MSPISAIACALYPSEGFRRSRAAQRVASRASYLLAEALEVAKLTGDLGVDVERVLALAGAALVAGDDELADLGDEGGIGLRRDRRRLHQPPQLGVDVDRRLAALDLAERLRLEHLPHLGLAGGRGPSRMRPCRSRDRRTRRRRTRSRRSARPRARRR